MQSDVRGQRQSAYHLLVATSPAKDSRPTKATCGTADGEFGRDDPRRLCRQAAVSGMQCYWKSDLGRAGKRVSVERARRLVHGPPQPIRLEGPMDRATAKPPSPAGGRRTTDTTASWPLRPTSRSGLPIDLGGPQRSTPCGSIRPGPTTGSPTRRVFCSRCGSRSRRARRPTSPTQSGGGPDGRRRAQPWQNAAVYRFPAGDRPLCASHRHAAGPSRRATTIGLALAEMEVLSGGKNVALGAKVTCLDSHRDGWLVDGEAGRRPHCCPSRARTNSLPATMVRKEFDGPRTRSSRADRLGDRPGALRASNQRPARGDHVLAPEWTRYSKRIQYQTYDVTGLLRDGQERRRGQVGRRLVDRPARWRKPPMPKPRFCLLDAAGHRVGRRLDADAS